MGVGNLWGRTSTCRAKDLLDFCWTSGVYPTFGGTLVIIVYSYHIRPLMTFELTGGHYHHNLASDSPLTMLGKNRTEFTINDLHKNHHHHKLSHQGFFWPSLVAIAQSILHLTSKLHESHHHLTSFGSHGAFFSVFNPRGHRSPRIHYPCRTFVAIPIYVWKE